MNDVMSVDVAAVIRDVLAETLQRDDVATWQMDTGLLGAVAEFDSMAVVTVLTLLEEHLGLMIDDDDISAETFETLGSLVAFVSERIT